MKLCKKCQKEKELSFFAKNANSKDGRYSVCKECKQIYDIEYKLKHSKKHREYSNAYNKNHRKEVTLRTNIYKKKRRKEDPLYKMTENLRTLVYRSLKNKGFSKSSKNFNILGISYISCLKYLFENAKIRYPDFEPKDFLESAKYHIDHIIPLSTAKTEEEVIRLCHYTNLQLLLAEENMKKHTNPIWN